MQSRPENSASLTQ